MIPQFMPVFDEEDAQAVYKVVRSGYINERDKTRLFEEVFGQYVESSHAITTTSGTMALFMALKAVGVGKGDEVIVPDMTMIGTANAVTLTGAKPILVDVSLGDGNMDLAVVEQISDKKVKAILPVHLNGRSVAMPWLVEIADKRGWAIIEDAAQCLGSYADGRHLGTSGHAGCFSMATTKIITSGGGGVVVTEDDELYTSLKALKDQGRNDRLPDGKFQGPEEYYPYEGYNLKFDEMKAALAFSQFRKLSARIAHKRHITNLYRELIGDCVDYPLEQKGALLWYFDIITKHSEKVRKKLAEKGIGSRSYYRPLHRQPQYSCRGDFGVANSLWKIGVFLPSSSNLTDEQIELISGVVKEAVA